MMMFRVWEWNRPLILNVRRSPRTERFKIRVTKTLLKCVITCCSDLLGVCSLCFCSHRAAGKLEPGEFYGHDLEKQLNRSLKMEERLRHTQEQVRRLYRNQANAVMQPLDQQRGLHVKCWNMQIVIHAKWLIQLSSVPILLLFL